MRFWRLFLWDIRFQVKYGFYFLYAVLTVIYALVLSAVPEGWREKTAVILIFSDPASMGLFFMGAIILLEKSQHTPCAVAVSPVCTMEYIAAKVGSLSVISFVVAGILALDAGIENVPMALFGTVISSVTFSLLGIVAATKIFSLNQFILWTVPIEIACFVPAVLHLFRVTPAWLRYYPVNACMDMISGFAPSVVGFCNVVVLIAVLFVVSEYCVLRMWREMGGVKL